ncbi:MAG: hypothetical protein ACTSYK_04950 [Alphaproteobacteria bacterium]
MPPAAIVLNQLVFGVVFGILSPALTTPLVAAATVPLRHMFGIGNRETDDETTTSA